MSLDSKKSATTLQQLVPVLLIASIVLAFAVGLLWQKVQTLENGTSTLAAANKQGVPDQPTQPQPQTAGEVDPVSDEDHIRGDKNAKIALIEYSDLECPFCKSFHPTAQQVVDEYDGKVMWVYRHFPLEQLHPKAAKEAEATECANELAGNDGFWTYVDKVYEVTPSNNGLDLDELPNIATEVGLNQSAFETCLDSDKYAQHVEDDFQSGVKAGVSGTPGNILLNVETGETVIIPGAVPFGQIKEAIDSMLSG